MELPKTPIANEMLTAIEEQRDVLWQRITASTDWQLLQQLDGAITALTFLVQQTTEQTTEPTTASDSDAPTAPVSQDAPTKPARQTPPRP